MDKYSVTTKFILYDNIISKNIAKYKNTWLRDIPCEMCILNIVIDVIVHICTFCTSRCKVLFIYS